MKTLLLICILIFLLPMPGEADNPPWHAQVHALAGDGGIVVSDGRGRYLYALNPDKPLIPASIFKIMTAGAALHYLGPSYRFAIEFRIGPKNDLYVLGKGDPHFVSEELQLITQHLKSKGLRRVRNILLDDSYFEPGLVLHGTERSLNPYDAFNGALCVNFNTVQVEIGKGGRVTSGESQTPLTNMARQMALRTGLKGKVRINLMESPETCLLYAGELLKVFLTRSSIAVEGQVTRNTRDVGLYRPFYQHLSSLDLSQLLEKMFKSSNNFMANQIFLTLGAWKYGPPAGVLKSRRAVNEYLSQMGLSGIHVEEGSGLSPLNRVTAGQMIKVLEEFNSHRSLLVDRDGVYLKTGSLKEVKSMAGYLPENPSQSLPFVIILNGPGYDSQTREHILSLLKKNLLEKSSR